jgi:His/Glu/Gln/Arg/opine family amino acid ABC transporter permease subunit
MSFDLLLSSLPFIMRGALVTLELTLAAVIIGFIGGVVFGMLTCNNIRARFITPIVDWYIFLIKGTPLSVQLLVAYFVLPEFLPIDISPLMAGVIALGCNAVASFTEIIKHDVDLIPQGQWEACQILGYPLFLTIRAIILPQTLQSSFPTLINETATILKETYIVSIIGAVELTKVAMSLGSRTLDPISSYFLIALIYLFMIWVLSVLARSIEKRFIYITRSQDTDARN